MAKDCTKSSEGHTKRDSQLYPEKLSRKAQPVTQHDYFTKMVNAIIDEDTGFSMEYIHLIKTPKQTPVWIKPFTNAISQPDQ